MPTWILLGLLCAFSGATSDAFSKKALTKHPIWLISWVRLLYVLPLLWTGLLWVNFPVLDQTFWIASLCALPLELVATLLYFKAIEVSPLSLTIPYLALTPIFLLGTAFLLMGEFPSSAGLIGILLITSGAYLINLDRRKQDLWAPFKAILKEQGSLYMIMVSFIYSITSTLGKIAIEHSSPSVFVIIYYTLLCILLGIVLYLKDPSQLMQVSSNPKQFLMIGLFYALLLVSHAYAIRLTKVAYLISLKRLAMIFSIGYGYLFFHETNIRFRLLGASVMLGGAILISIYP